MITVSDLNTVYINGEAFKGVGYGGYRTANTITYIEQPTRAITGEIVIDDYDSFIVPRFEVTFSYMKPADYYRLKSLLLMSKRLQVNYYDLDMQQRVTWDMYAEPAELQDFFNRGTNIYAVQNYKLSFIGLLSNMPTMSITYNMGAYATLKTINVYSISTTYSTGNIVKSSSVAPIKYYKYINTTSASGISLDDADYWQLLDSTIMETQQIIWGNSLRVVGYNDIITYYSFENPTYQPSYFSTNADGSGYNFGFGQSVNVLKNITLYLQYAAG